MKDGLALVTGAVVFMSELVLWGGLGYAAFRLARPWGTLPAVAAAIVTVVAVIAVWSLWLAPRTPYRLPTWARVAVIVAMFAALGALLVAAGMPGTGIAIAAAGALIHAYAQPTVKVG